MKLDDVKRAAGRRIAPAVGLLLFADQALADDQCDEIDCDTAAVVDSEPSTLALVALGAAGAGIARAVSRRRKSKR